MASPGLAFDNFSPALAITPARVGIVLTQGVARIHVAGSFGSAYDVQYTPTLSPTNWQTLERVVLTNAPEQFLYETSVSNSPMRFYRAAGVE